MMKRKLITLTAVGALALGGLAVAQTPTPQTPIGQTPKTPVAQTAGRGGQHGKGGQRGDPFAKLSERLNLTAEQKAKAQPIFDQARPELTAMKQDTMQKTKAIMDKVQTQLRPLLTAEQQKTLDSQQKGRGQGGKKGQKGMQDGTNE